MSVELADLALDQLVGLALLSVGADRDRRPEADVDVGVCGGVDDRAAPRSSRSRSGHSQIGSMGTLSRNQSRNSADRSIGTSMSWTTRSRGGRPLRFSMRSAMLNRWS